MTKTDNMPYGRKVVGKEEAARRQKRVARKGARYGHKVGDGEPTPELEESQQQQTGEPPKPLPTGGMDEETFEALMAAHANDDGYLSIDALKEALEDAPTAYNRLLSWELNRADGPRVGALTHLLGEEQKRATGPRAPVMAAIEGALRQARGG